MNDFNEIKKAKKIVSEIYKKESWYRGAGVGGSENNYFIIIYTKINLNRGPYSYGGTYSNNKFNGIIIKFYESGDVIACKELNEND